MANCELTCLEREDLDKLEAVVNRGLSTFVEVGRALLAIRDRRLYRESHPTFEDYCLAQWTMTRTHANRLIGAFQVVENLAPIGATVPANEAQARTLTGLPPEQQREVWREATATGEQPTAASLADLVARAKASLPPDATEGEAEAEAVRQSERRILDQGERDRRQELVQAMLRTLRKLRRQARQLDDAEAKALDRIAVGKAEAWLEKL